MGFIAFVFLGLLTGLVAKAIMPGKDPGGIVLTTLIGVAGALAGGFLAGVFFDVDPLDEFFDLSTWITAVVGALILLILYRAITGRQNTPDPRSRHHR